jgi:hypothetical protein
LLPISFDKFVAVSGTLLARDSAIVRTWQSAPRSQPTSARDRTSPPGSVGRPTAGGPRSSTSLAANMPSDRDPFTLARRQPNPVYVEMSHFRVPIGDLIRYRRRSKANSHSGGPFWATRSTPSCATRIEPRPAPPFTLASRRRGRPNATFRSPTRLRSVARTVSVRGGTSSRSSVSREPLRSTTTEPSSRR